MKKHLIALICISAFIFCFSSCSDQANIQGTKDDLQEYPYGNLYSLGLVAGYGDKIYFTDLHDNSKGLYLADMNGKNKTMIHESVAQSLNIYEHRIYFVGENDCIYSMELDGSNCQLVYEGGVGSLTVYKDKIYFVIRKDGGLYAMDLNGKNLKCLVKDVIGDMAIYDNYLYYSIVDTSIQETKLLRMPLDEEGSEVIVENLSTHFFIYKDDVCYYLEGDIYIRNIKSGEVEKIVSGGVAPIPMNINNGILYYVVQHAKGNHLKSYDLHNSKEKTLRKDIPNHITDIFIVNNKIFYYDIYAYGYQDNLQKARELWCMDLNGKNKRLFD